MKIAIFGAGGRMGRALVRLVCAAEDIELVGAVEAPGSPHLGRDAGELSGAGTAGVALGADLSAGLLGAEVLIDFSHASAFGGMLRVAMRHAVAVVSGTTRIGPDDDALMARAAERIPLLWAPNMSLGVAVLAALVGQAVRALGAGYDLEIVETHHAEKADAPSGTAALLFEAAARARDGLVAVHGREGLTGARRAAEIGVHAVRGGGVVGDHQVHLLGPFDRLELCHRALDRDLFAAGALRAARWLQGKPPGRYRLAEVVGAGARPG